MEQRSTRVTRALLLVAALAILAVPAASADTWASEPLYTTPAAAEGAVVDETAGLWFVELASAPTADGASLETVKAEKAAFRRNAKRAGIAYTERYAFDTLWNGLSVRADATQVAAIGRLPGVANVYPVITVEAPEGTSEPDLGTALAMTGADVAQSELGLDGTGVKVAIMDTGVDYNHPDLGGSGVDSDSASVDDAVIDPDFPGSRVVAGWDFVGDAFNANPADSAYNPTPAPDADPDDCHSHGTHVAGIVGAKSASSGGVTGVAPGVKFGAYRVFGCGGSTTADIMIAAMERALADGMHVLNMSIGSAFQWPDYPTAEASDRAVNKGMSVVASIGNSGADGMYSTGAPGNGKKVIGVASFDNSHVKLNTFTITPDGAAIGYGSASAAPVAPTSGSLPMARTGTPTSGSDACSPLAAGSLAGRAALIRRGGCTFHTKALNAQNAGAAAVVLYNNSPGRFAATVAGTPAIAIPVVSISDAEGVLINNRLAAGPVTLTWTSAQGTFANPTGGLISSFSSYGMAPDLTLKPDIGGPGGLIRSTYPLERGGYATISGTSMSSPHVAGGVALLLQARPNTPANAIRAILQNSADPKAWWGNPGLGFLDNVHRQGAGMIDIDDAITSTTKVEPGKLELGESEAGPQTRTLTVENSSGSAVTYDLSHAPALSTGGNTFAPSFFTGFASAAFSQAGAPVSSVTVPGGGSASFDVTVTANAALADRSQYGGYVVLTPQGGGKTYRVPYAGFKGDYQSIKVLTPTASGFPWLGRRTGGSPVAGFTYAKQNAGAVYTMTDALNVPYFLAHFDHQSRRLVIEVRDAAGKSWHRASTTEYLGRNQSSTGIFAFAFDGTTTAGNKTYVVPDGDYVLSVRLEKALGDSSNPAHVETWTSPVFTIDRP